MLFGEMLIQRGLVTQNDIKAALEIQQQLRARGVQERLGVLLVLTGALPAEALADTLCELSALSKPTSANPWWSRSH
jgi:hypothetical protein